jgi:hypothetical protein
VVHTGNSAKGAVDEKIINISLSLVRYGSSHVCLHLFVCVCVCARNIARLQKSVTVHATQILVHAEILKQPFILNYQ